MNKKEHSSKNDKVRVRFAPSPTGHLHVGGARTALFNWLFARKNKGTFILRIEDTDETRSTQESLGGIVESLKWLGIDWDEGPHASGSGSKGKHGPYFQMQRLDIYKEHADLLLKEGKAYKCYCTPGELDAMRKQALFEKRSLKYMGRCRELTREQQNALEAQGRTYTIRLKMPRDGFTEFKDLVHGDSSFENNLQDDVILIKGSGIPTYHFACVIDDHFMKVNHIIRGDDHLSNTPKQIMLFDYFGWQKPQFAHISMILGSDGARLSKRHGASSMMDFQEQGYLARTMVNYLALLGWGTETSQDLFEPDELISKFGLDRCQKSPASFDYGKLTWMNGIYIRKLPKRELFKYIKPYLPANDVKEEDLENIVALEQEKYQTLKDAGRLLDFFFDEKYEYHWDDLSRLKGVDLKNVASALAEKIDSMDRFTATSIEQALRELSKEMKLKTAQVFHPLRFAISGRLQGPSLFHMVEALNKDRTLSRLRRFSEEISARYSQKD
ncbi:glutamate--tRNA ligase [Elusimicrobiota bacterium]